MTALHPFDAALGEISGGQMLDVGVGAGGFAGRLLEGVKDFAHLTGVDAHNVTANPDLTFFDRDDVTFRQMDATALDFPADHFDTVSIAYTLHHLDDPARVLAEMRRVLKPGGRFIVVEMQRDDLTPAQESHRLLHHLAADIDRARGKVHHHTYRRAAITGLIEDIGLREIAWFDWLPARDEPDDDPRDAERLARITTTHERVLALLDELPEAEAAAFRARAEASLQHVRTHGFQGATNVMAIGTK